MVLKVPALSSRNKKLNLLFANAGRTMLVGHSVNTASTPNMGLGGAWVQGLVDSGHRKADTGVAVIDWLSPPTGTGAKLPLTKWERSKNWLWWLPVIMAKEYSLPWTWSARALMLVGFCTYTGQRKPWLTQQIAVNSRLPDPWILILHKKSASVTVQETACHLSLHRSESFWLNLVKVKT